MRSDSIERRRSPRSALQRAVKLYDPRGRRYRVGMTIDISAGGALVEVRGGMHGEAGEMVGIVIDWSESKTLLGQADLVPAMITRSESGDLSTQRIAVRFTGGDAQPVAA